jgi:hypothetical protein
MRLKHLFNGVIFSLFAVLAGCGGDGGTTSPSPEAKLAVRQKAAAASYNNAVQELYIAYYGRPADPGGLSNFELELSAFGAPTDLPSLSAAYQTNPLIKTLIDSFGNSTESANLYGNGNTSAFVTAVFTNVLGRAPASSGLAFWVDQIDHQGLSKGNAAAAIMAGALTNTTAAGLVDAQTIANKVTAASSFSSALNVTAASAVGEPTAGVYVGAAAAASARSMLAQVNSTTNMTAFHSTVTATLASLTATLQAENLATIQLTTSTPASSIVDVGAFNGNASNCGNTDFPGCGFTPAGGICTYYTTSTGTQFIGAIATSWQDANNRNLAISINTFYQQYLAPMVVGQTVTSSFTGPSLSIVYVGSQVEFISTKNSAVTVTAVSTTGMTLSLDNVPLVDASNSATEFLSGTVQVTCDKTKAIYD